MLRFASGLRFPHLFAIAGTLFLLDLLIPDLIPFADELLLGLVTLILASIKRASPRPLEARGHRRRLAREQELIAGHRDELRALARSSAWRRLR